MVDNMKPINNIKQLRDKYSDSSLIKALMDCFAKRKNNSNTVKVNRLQTILSWQGESVRWGDLVKALKDLEALGYCRYVEGRRGHPSRVEWHVGIISLGQAAAGLREDIEGAEVIAEPKEDEFDDGDARSENGRQLETVVGKESMVVSYPLRPDLVIQLEVPISLSQHEADRLASFIKTLPFEARSAAA